MQQNKNIKILVTGVGGPAGINIVRLLKDRNGVEVTGCDVDATASGQLFVDHFVIAPFVRDTATYKEWMIRAVNEGEFNIVIPTVDEELSLLATFVSELSAFVPLSPLSTLSLCADKNATYDWVKENLSEYVAASILLKEWTPEWKDYTEFFIKPRSGRGGRGCKVVKKEELVWLKENEPTDDDFIVMECLPGTEWTVDAYVTKANEIAYLIPRERLALAGGISIKGKTVRHEGVIEATTLLLKKLQFHGPVCIQWKADAGGQPLFVEINPRLSGGLMISAAAGVDPVAALLDEFQAKPMTVQEWREIMVVGYLEYKALNT